eukprot:5397153-Prymnesium_polylepis.1
MSLRVGLCVCFSDQATRIFSGARMYVGQRARNGQNLGFGRRRGPPRAVAESWDIHPAPCTTAGQHILLGLRKG